MHDETSLTSSWNKKCFRQNFQRKSKHILCSTHFIENHAVCGNVEKYYRAGQATDVGTIQRKRDAICVTNT